MLNNIQAHDQSGQEKARQNRHPAQTSMSGKSTHILFILLIFFFLDLLKAKYLKKTFFIPNRW